MEKKTNLSDKGYANRGSVFTVELPDGKTEVFTSNACRWEGMAKKARLPEGTKLVNSTTYFLSNGKNKNYHTEVIWVTEGSSASGKSSTEYLLEIGAITEDEATAILNAKTVTL